MKSKDVKQSYSEAKLELMLFSACDVITTSGGNDSPDSSDTDWGGVQTW